MTEVTIVSTPKPAAVSVREEGRSSFTLRELLEYVSKGTVNLDSEVYVKLRNSEPIAVSSFATEGDEDTEWLILECNS